MEESIKNKTFQIENNPEEVINNKTYEIYKDLSKQLNDIYNETMAYCENTRIEETSLEISLSVELNKLQVDLLWLRNETLGEFLNLTNKKNNLQKEIHEGLENLTSITDNLQTEINEGFINLANELQKEINTDNS